MREPPQAIELAAHLFLAQTEQDENYHQQEQCQPVPVDCRFHGGIDLAAPSKNRSRVLRAEPLDGVPDDGHVSEGKNVEHRRYLGALFLLLILSGKAARGEMTETLDRLWYNMLYLQRL